MAVGSTSRIARLLDYLGVPTVTGGTWEGGTISGMIANEKYKNDPGSQGGACGGSVYGGIRRKDKQCCLASDF